MLKTQNAGLKLALPAFGDGSARHVELFMNER